MMPTALPIRAERAAAIRRLSWPDSARFVILVMRVRWLNWRLEVGHLRVKRDGLDAAGSTLLLAARRWLDAHAAISALLGTPEPPEVTQLRALLTSSSPARVVGAGHEHAGEATGRP